LVYFASSVIVFIALRFSFERDYCREFC